jgi:LmbE family N-acetylglucosaminyl deacetylase
MTKSRTLPTIPTIAAFLVAAVVLSAGAGSLLQLRTLHGARTIDVSRLGQRVLVIASHPDDEVLMAGGAIRQLLAQGAQVRVVIVTAGDGYFRAARGLSPGRTGASAYRRLGDVRHGESLAAAADLGLPVSDVISLGFPDGGASALWDADWSSVAKRAGRNGAASVPYSWAADAGAPYTGQSLASQLVGVLKDFRPDTVISPDVHETHPDHSAVAAFALYALDEAGFTGTRLTAIVHFKHFPYPWGFLPDAWLAPPATLAGDGSTWLALPLSEADERAKRAALEQYHSQTAVADLAVYMRALVRRNELFDDRPAAVPATQPTDAPPTPGATGTVVVTPAPVLVPSTPTRGRIGSIRMVRGPHTVWIGIVCDEPIVASFDYRISVRLIGGRQAPARLDVLAHRGSVSALRVSADSVTPAGLTTGTDGRTVWISLPASAFDGRTHALLRATAGAAATSPFRTAVRDVSL